MSQAIQWPKAKIGQVEYTLRMSYSAWQQLLAWGLDINASVPLAAYAAAQAGQFDRNDKWRSAAFRSWVEVADAITEMSAEDQTALHDAVLESLKKVRLDAETKTQSDPAN